MISTSQKLFTSFRHQSDILLSQKFVKNFKLLLKTQSNFSIAKNNENNQHSRFNQVNFESINLFNHQNYSIRVLTQQHKQQALKMFNQDFNNHNPFTNAYWRLFPEDKISFDKQMHAFWQQNINNAIQNRLGIAVIDMEKDQLAGASIAQPFSHHASNQTEEKQMKKVKFIDSAYSLLQILIKTSQKKQRIIFQQNSKIVENIAAVVAKQHMGKKLFKQIITGRQQLAKKQGFQYAFVFSANFRTNFACSGLGYEKASQIDCRQFQYLGVKPFSLLKEQDSLSSIWLKKI